jgi:hypothetical protein
MNLDKALQRAKEHIAKPSPHVDGMMRSKNGQFTTVKLGAIYTIGKETWSFKDFLIKFAR